MSISLLQDFYLFLWLFQLYKGLLYFALNQIGNVGSAKATVSRKPAKKIIRFEGRYLSFKGAVTITDAIEKKKQYQFEFLVQIEFILSLFF